MNTIKAFGKFLDQPKLVNKFYRTIPPVLMSAGAGVVIKNAYKSSEEDRKKVFVRDGLTMFGAVLSSLYAPNIISNIFRTAPDVVKSKQIKEYNAQLVNKFLSKNQVNKETEIVLEKIKTKILNINDIKILFDNLNSKDGKNLISKLIPEPENITSKNIFSEIGRLSFFGLIPVLGGITGGIAGDIATKNNYKDKIPNKIKEGAYQYLANIFLCNIGAGAALALLEKFNIKSKSARAVGMISGIITTGVICGSMIANLIGEKIINRCFKNQDETKRKPEPIDICLHSDDIATVAVMSGLKWIEPVLPALYAVSGYRAGIGYRGKNKNNQ